MDRKLEAVVSDLDGTFFGLNTERISLKDRETVAKLKAKGIPVFIVTGRHYEFCIQHVWDLGFDYPAVCANGGQVYDYNEKRTLSAHLIPAHIARQMEDYLFANHINFIVYTTKGAFFNGGNPRAEYWKKVMGEFDEQFRVPIQYIDASFPVQEYEVFKILLSQSTPEIERKINELFNQGGDLQTVWSGKALMDINGKGATKGEGVRFLSQKYGFKLENTLAMGDNFNDITMLEICGIPVAPLGAEDGVKAKACMITTDCEHSPLTHAITTLFPDLL